MNDRTRKIIGTIFTILAIGLMYYIRDIVAYILISIVLTIIFSPFMRVLDKVRIKKRGFPDWLKALLCLMLLYSLIAVFINVFTPILISEIKQLSQVKLEDVNKALSGPLEYIETRSSEWNLQDGDKKIDRKFIQNKVLGLFDVKEIPMYFASLVSGVGSFLLAIFSVSFITFFFLKDRHILHNAIEVIVPGAYLEKARHVVVNANKVLQRYFIGLLIQVSVITTFVSVSLTIVGIENAFLIGFFAGLINIIPYLGPMIGALVGIVIALTTNLDMYSASTLLPFLLKILGVFAVVQLMDNLVFQPLIFSNSINAHPLEIFLVILIAGSLFGIPGMIIAIPAYSFVRIVAREFFSQFKLVKGMTRK